jgi:predicted transposase YdaD
MPGPWDSTMKDLLRKNPQQFTEWLVEGSTFIEALSIEFKRRDTYIYADGLYKIKLQGELVLLHIEFQKRNDPDMAERLLEYNVQANREYGPLPVFSYVIYLVDDGSVPEPPLIKTLPDGTEILRFYYGILKLWEVSSEAVLNTGLTGLFPMLTLTREGKRPEVLDEMLDTLVATESQELLTIAYALASLVFRSEVDKKMLKRRFAMLGEILRDSWVYREIMDEGRDEGLRQGLQQGIQQGLQQGLQQGIQQGLQQGIQQEREEFLQTLRNLLIGMLQTTFPDLVQLAIRRVSSMKDPAILQNVMLKLLTAKNVEEAKLILTSASTEPG